MATKTIPWNTGTGNIILTYSGQGDGTISVQSDANNLGSTRIQVITIETTKGGPVITKNLTISQAACPVPVGTVLNYTYTGTVQSVLLPAGKYKLQCWGAQGGSNAADSSYGITSKAGGKGGYSEGVLTLSSTTKVYIFVGGQGGSSGNGGWNGGGGGSGSSTYNSGGTLGTSRMGCGGGSTDIALVTSSMNYSSYRTNRSSASLLSRMIVAGGGNGGAFSHEIVTSTSWEIVNEYTVSSWWTDSTNHTRDFYFQCLPDMDNGEYYKIESNDLPFTRLFYKATSGWWTIDNESEFRYDKTAYPPDTSWNGGKVIALRCSDSVYNPSAKIKLYKQVTTTSTRQQWATGLYGGGLEGGSSVDGCKGKQNVAGSGGSFGQGANQTATNYRYCSACGGSGWYGGGGGQNSDSDIYYCSRSGGGSGFVNTAASAGNRPSGYTGLQLDSGSTTAGDSSFPAPNGGNETGHSGNGYARITRLS